MWEPCKSCGKLSKRNKWKALVPSTHSFKQISSVPGETLELVLFLLGGTKTVTVAQFISSAWNHIFSIGGHCKRLCAFLNMPNYIFVSKKSRSNLNINVFILRNLSPRLVSTQILSSSAYSQTHLIQLKSMRIFFVMKSEG